MAQEMTLDDLTTEELYRMLDENPDQEEFSQEDLAEHGGGR